MVVTAAENSEDNMIVCGFLYRVIYFLIRRQTLKTPNILGSEQNIVFTTVLFARDTIFDSAK
jgi:hypothetical protein